MAEQRLSVQDEQFRRTASEFSGLAPACGPVAGMP